MPYKELLLKIKHPKTKKPLRVDCYRNDWLVQVIVENKFWNQCYFANPPGGIPSFVAASVEKAEEVAYRNAWEDATIWVETYAEGTGT